MVRNVNRALVVGALLIGLAAVPAALAQGLVEDGPAPSMFLIYTGDVIGYIDPCG